MTFPRRIGDDLTQVIDWMQDRFNMMRPIAATVAASMLTENALVKSPYGMVLFEDDEEIEKRSRNVSSSQSRRYRGRHSRHGKLKLTDWSSAAEDMILAHIAAQIDES